MERITLPGSAGVVGVVTTLTHDIRWYSVNNLLFLCSDALFSFSFSDDEVVLRIGPSVLALLAW
jgi:hypothetical protein